MPSLSDKNEYLPNEIIGGCLTTSLVNQDNTKVLDVNGLNLTTGSFLNILNKVD